METRARYALIGLFLLAVIVASFGFVYWLNNKGGFGERETYRIEFESSVPGLLVGSAVLFNGIRVGDVTGVGLNPAVPRQVIAEISVLKGTPIREDTAVNVEQQGLTGGVAVTLTGGVSSAQITANGGIPTLVAPPGVGEDWTQSARDAFQQVELILSENQKPLNSAVENIEVFTEALARNADKVDGILAGIERMTGGGKDSALLYSLKPAGDLPPAPDAAPSWKLLIPEPTTLLAFNTDKILTRPAPDESLPLDGPRWSDSLPILIQAKLLETFENAGYADAVTRTIGEFPDNAQLSINVRQFDVTTDGDPVAKIVILAKLQGPAGEVLQTRKFETTEPAAGNGSRDYVDALSTGFERTAREMFDWTLETLAAMPQSDPAIPPEDPASDRAVTVEPPAPLDDIPLPPEP